MPEHILFLTGRLAGPSLARVLDGIEPRAFTHHVHDLGLSVAALMTTDMIQRRLGDTMGADRIIVPGCCAGSVEALSERLGVSVERGPKDLKDLPEFFGGKARQADLSRYAIRIFAEIVEAPGLTLEAIVARAEAYRRDGADVIDLGCLPGQPFPHLEESVQELKRCGFAVSVDSMDEQELLRGGRAGADHLLSLRESTLWIADEVAATPVLIPESPEDPESLHRAIDALTARGRSLLADSILDPIHFGFTRSLARYQQLRERYPQAPIMMGTGNLTELTDADTSGVTALLFGIASELDVAAVLTTEVSGHARSAVREADLARRIVRAAREDAALPRGYHAGLMTHHDRKPFPDTPEEIAATAAAVKDPSFRVQVSEQGIHVYNRDGLHVAGDPFDLYPRLGVENDGGHAFYLGVELARAEIAWKLGKRYRQDEPLAWGALLPEDDTPPAAHHAPGTTLQGKRGNK